MAHNHFIHREGTLCTLLSLHLACVYLCDWMSNELVIQLYFLTYLTHIYRTISSVLFKTYHEMGESTYILIISNIFVIFNSASS